MALQGPPPPKKKGLSCLGCGCAILLVLLLLLLGLIGTLAYVAYREVLVVTSTAPLEIPAYTGSDDVYNGAVKKIDAFNQAVGTGNPASLTLGVDEVNALLAHDPTLAKYQAHMVVTLTGDEAHLEGTLPTSTIPFLRAAIKDRYFNVDTRFALTFNSDTKVVGMELHKAKLGDTDWPTNQLPTLQAELNPIIDSSIKRNPTASNAVVAAKTVAIRDGQFVIETK